MKTIKPLSVILLVLLLLACAPKYISNNGNTSIGYFNYAELYQKYGIKVTSLSTFEGLKYDAIGELAMRFTPSFLNKDDYNKLPEKEKSSYFNIKYNDPNGIPLYLEIIPIDRCIDDFMKEAKNKGANGILEFRNTSEIIDIRVFSTNSPGGFEKGECLNYYGILVKIKE